MLTWPGSSTFNLNPVIDVSKRNSVFSKRNLYDELKSVADDLTGTSDGAKFCSTPKYDVYVDLTAIVSKL